MTKNIVESTGEIGRIEHMSSTSKGGVRDNSRALSASNTQVQSTNPTFDVLSDTELCGFCREPAILSTDSDNDSKLFQTLRNQFLSTTNQDECEFVGDIYPFCPPCKTLSIQLWECEELIKKTLEKVERVKTKFERRVVDDILSDPEFQSTTQLSLPEKQKRNNLGIVQLRNNIFENYRKKVRVEKLQKLSYRSNTNEKAASADTLSLTNNGFPEKHPRTQPKTGRDTSAMNGKGTSGSYERAGTSYKETYSSRVTLKERIPVTSNKKTGAAAGGDSRNFTRRDENNFSCIFCPKSYATKKGLMRHLQTHTGEKPFNCYLCSMPFARNSDMIKHLGTHTGEKPFKCNVCNKSFNRQSTLTSHSRIHTGERPFRCSICEKRFGQKCNLTRHFRFHTGEKPFKCEVCCKTFSDTSNLNAHKKIHETKP